MKLHDLRPPEGSNKARTRVGRGIAAGKGKTAGRGTKGQKARAGGSIPPWFEGGQTPLHMRIPKLRGFKNRFKIEYEIVNVGAIGALAERGAFEAEARQGRQGQGRQGAPITVNQDILRAVGLVRTLDKPMKILGAGDLSVPLFVVADAFTASARHQDRGGRRHRSTCSRSRRRPCRRSDASRRPTPARRDAAEARGEGRRRRRAGAPRPSRPTSTADARPRREPEPEAAEPETVEAKPAKAAEGRDAKAAKADAPKAAKPAKATRGQGREGRRERCRRRGARRRARPPRPTTPRRAAGDA